MYLSIVSTLYRSAPFIEEFVERVSRAALRLTDQFEIILVNDGSPDDSIDIAISLHQQNERIKVVDLSRNFGHHKAMMTGLMYAKGDLVFLIDSDLEEEPELLQQFFDEMQRSGSDVVYGVQHQRKGTLFEQITGTIYFRVFNFLSTHPIPENLITARLMTQRYVSALVQHQERETVISGLWAITGFQQVALKVNKLSRGQTSYNFGRKISHLVNTITAFSNRPLLIVFYMGAIISSVAFLFAVRLIVRSLFFDDIIAGYPSLIVSIWLLGGLTIFSIGLIGLYLSKIFTEVKQRPYTIVRALYEHAEDFEPDEFRADLAKRESVL